MVKHQMDRNKLIEISQKIANGNSATYGRYAEALEFFRMYIGIDNYFFKELVRIKDKIHYDYIDREVIRILNAFKNYLEKDLDVGFSVSRRMQLETVSDYLEQAELLLRDEKMHPAAATIIIGASLEEFLRNWIESESLEVETNKPSIDAYAKKLKEKELINKQDFKDITAWAGLRNDASHGFWDKVADRNKIEIMLLGVNLFIKSNSK